MTAELLTTTAVAGRVRRTSETNATYRLDATDRYHLGILALMDLWPKEHLARAFGVSRKTVAVCADRVLDLWEGQDG